VSCVLIAVGASSCRRGVIASRPAQGAILVSLDTLRPDHLGCYGYPLPTSPNIDSLRREAVLFRTAIAHGPSTFVSHASMLTSLDPPRHGASSNRRTALPSSHLTLAEAVRAHGVATASFNGGGRLDPAYGLAQGFDVYDSHVAGGDTLASMVDAGLAWLGQHRADRFFLFLHTYEVHAPYSPAASDLAALGPPCTGSLPPVIGTDLLRAINTGRRGLQPGDLDCIRRAYDADIRSMDRGIGRLVAGLRAMGLFDRTLLVLTADHGEEFGEHGKVGTHSHTLFDELLRVPLLVKVPGSGHAGAAVEAMVRSKDVAPTVVSALGFPIPKAFEGLDLVAIVEGRVAPPAVALSQLDGGGTSVRTPRWKWVRGQLFDLENDPGETRDLSGELPEREAQLRRLRDHLVGRTGAPSGERVEIDEALRERLRSLGYVE